MRLFKLNSDAGGLITEYQLHMGRVMYRLWDPKEAYPKPTIWRTSKAYPEERLIDFSLINDSRRTLCPTVVKTQLYRGDRGYYTP